VSSSWCSISARLPPRTDLLSLAGKYTHCQQNPQNQEQQAAAVFVSRKKEENQDNQQNYVHFILPSAVLHSSLLHCVDG
jgi:hypothetical protein